MIRFVAGIFASLAAAAVLAAPALSEGRQLSGAFCGNRCISLTFGDQATASNARTDFTLRPGVYWLTVHDTSNFHNFTLQGPDGLDLDITPAIGNPDGAPGDITVKIELKPGSYRLLCDEDSHAEQGMYVDFEVGGVGQVE